MGRAGGKVYWRHFSITSCSRQCFQHCTGGQTGDSFCRLKFASPRAYTLNMSLEATVEGHTDVSLYIKIMTSADFQALFLPVIVIAHVGMLLRFIPFTCSHNRLRKHVYLESLARTLRFSISAFLLVLKYFRMNGVPRMEQRKHFSSLRE